MSKKIDISKYDLTLFSTAYQNSMKNGTDFYQAGDYLSFLKHRCLSLFLHNSFFAFFHWDESPSAYQFPSSGRDHDFQAFKKLNLAEKIPDFNKCHSDFYATIKPDWEKIQSIMNEHRNRWKSLPAHEKVDLIDKLHSLYKGKDNSEIHNQYFIYENQYLHQQFDRFLSAKDFNDWWENEVIKILQ